MNEPLYYKGVRIYQASFGDGGSDVSVNLFRLDGKGGPQEISGRVYTKFEDPYSEASLEFQDFRQYNIENLADRGAPKDFTDMGPAVDFILRDKDRKPVLVRSFQDPFTMGDQNNGSFMMLSSTGQARDFETYSLGLDFSDPKEWLVYQRFMDYALTAEESTKEQGLNAFIAVVDEVYPEGYPYDKKMLGNRVLKAMQVLPQMPWSFVPILNDYEKKHYTGLQLAKDPGMDVVWIGSALLVFGLCIMFYVAHRKVWIRVEDAEGVTHLQVTGLSNRNPIAFEQEFEDFEKQIQSAYGQEPEQEKTQEKGV